MFSAGLEPQLPGLDPGLPGVDPGLQGLGPVAARSRFWAANVLSISRAYPAHAFYKHFYRQGLQTYFL